MAHLSCGEITQYQDQGYLIPGFRLAEAKVERLRQSLERQLGQLSMHDVHMIHGARVNRSTQRRAGVALRYMPGSSVFERALNPTDGKSGLPVAFATRPLWLLRGQDRTGRNDFGPEFKSGFCCRLADQAGGALGSAAVPRGPLRADLLLLYAAAPCAPPS